MDPRAVADYEALLEAEEEPEEIRAMEMTWAEKLENKGVVRGMQQLLLLQLTQRFGPLPGRVTRRINSLKSVDRLSSLADKVLTASSLEEMGLGA